MARTISTLPVVNTIEDTDQYIVQRGGITNRINSGTKRLLEVQEQYIAEGYPIAGNFVQGCTVTEALPWVLASDYTLWKYTVSFPFTIAQGVTPSEPDYELVNLSDHNSTSNRNAIGAHDAIYSRNFETLSDTTDALFSTSDAGNRVAVKERTSGNGGGGQWDIVLTSGVTPNGYNIVQSTGNSLLSFVLVEDKAIYAEQYVDDPNDIGGAWNFADARANTMGWPFYVPAGHWYSSVGLTWDGIFHDVIGAGVDICKIEFTTDVQGLTFRGGRLEGIQLIGVGALSTQVGLLMSQNQRHILDRVKCTKFLSGFKFSGGNLSYFNNIFGVENNQHGFIADMDSADNNSITVGMMDLRDNGINGLQFTSGTPSNVSQQWHGGIISCQGNGGQGFSLSGRGHDLTFYEENNGLSSRLDANCNGSKVRMLYGTVNDIGNNNEVIRHRKGAVEAVIHDKFEAERVIVRDRDYDGQLGLIQSASNTFELTEDGSSAPSTLQIKSRLGVAFNLDVTGRLTGAQTTNTNLATTFDARFVRSAIITNSAPTTITAITGSKAGQEITFIFADGNTTIQNGSSIRLSGGTPFAATIYDTITLIYTGSTWREVSRSINA